LGVWYLWLLAFYTVWTCVVLINDLLPTVLEHWPMAAAMAVGSYAAGSTPMGGGTVGFPVLVLWFEFPPSLERDFSFAIQAIGMTSASIFILARRQPLAQSMLKGALLGSVIGTPLGVLYVAHGVPELLIKLVFAVLWASFGILHLLRLDEIADHTGMTDFDERWDFRVGLLAGLFAALFISSVTGVGIDMVLYSILVLVCRADLKIAIPTSVIIMAFTSVMGVLVKLFLDDGLMGGVFENWLAAAPVVAVGAPIGALVVSRIGRRPTLLVVASLCVAQYLWTLYSERTVLGAIGTAAAIIAVLLCLLVLDRLRRYGAQLVGDKS
jgi:uncharacterized membrane protein YfcA